MSPALPASCQVALKEWASVIDACARGEQLVLIRKGGLVESRTGFEVRSESVVFYPTFEHQTVHFLRDSYRPYLDEALARRAPEGQVRFDVAGLLVWSTQTLEASVVERLEPFHVYNRAFLEQRLKWQPDQPLVIAAVRAFRLAAPVSLPVVDRYAGCKSWVELDAPVSLLGATPVLDEEAFAERLASIRAILGALVG